MTSKSRLLSSRSLIPSRLRRYASLAALLVAVGAVGCGPKAEAAAPTVAELRHASGDGASAQELGEWLWGELLLPGGKPKEASEARARLEKAAQPGHRALVAMAYYDAVHGELASAANRSMEAVVAASAANTPDAEVFAWYAAEQAWSLRESGGAAFWKKWQPQIQRLLEAPGAMGWRARDVLGRWVLLDAGRRGEGKLDELTVKEYGCLADVRVAGPFGRGLRSEVFERFPAEDPGPWAERWPTAPGREAVPRVRKLKREGCDFTVDDGAPQGVYYTETYLSLAAEQELILVAPGAVAVWVDDQEILRYNPRDWGDSLENSLRVRLRAGRHRVLARHPAPEGSLRVLTTDGRGAQVKSSTDPSAGYDSRPPLAFSSADALPLLLAPEGAERLRKDAPLRFVAALLVADDGRADIGSVWLEPFVKDAAASTGPMLNAAAIVQENDPIFQESQSQDLIRELQSQAVKKDPKLWRARLGEVLRTADTEGLPGAARGTEKIMAEFPGVPAVGLTLVELYSQLGWDSEYERTVIALAKRYPEQSAILQEALHVYEKRGDRATADQLEKRILDLDPQSSIRLERAMRAFRWDDALKELERRRALNPNDDDDKSAIDTLLVRMGRKGDDRALLEKAVADAPTNGKARLALADFLLAAGDDRALERTLLEAAEAGASTDQLARARVLVEGTTDLAPFRMDAKKVISEFEASGATMSGTAARILDYSAIWLQRDGSALMLEHEIVRVQSEEAISRLAEHEQLRGLVLNLRVIKKDGRVLEPESVSGKPTVTFPHLEVGDYIETEQILTSGTSGFGGTAYLGPRWFFREPDVAYARSEFVVISPKERELLTEPRNGVPAPEVRDLGAFVLRRWRMDQVPAGPVEPASPSVTEFLPNVLIGWGEHLQPKVAGFSDGLTNYFPVDPRVKRIAERIVEGVPTSNEEERLRRLYRWIMENVQAEDETDGRKVVVSKAGHRGRGFATLCDALGLSYRWVVARNRLAEPPRGPLSESLAFEGLLLRAGQKGSYWLAFGDKRAPFGFLPAEYRSVEAYELGPKPTKIVTPAQADSDGVETTATGALAADGSAVLKVALHFRGGAAVSLREQLAQIPERRLPELFQNIVGQEFAGGVLLSHALENLEALDLPVVLRYEVRVPRFAAATGPGQLRLEAPFVVDTKRLAVLPERKTPLLVSQELRQRIQLELELPAGFVAEVPPQVKRTQPQGRWSLVVADALQGNKLTLRRELFVTPGRIAVAEYGEFAAFATGAADAQRQALVIHKK